MGRPPSDKEVAAYKQQRKDDLAAQQRAGTRKYINKLLADPVRKAEYLKKCAEWYRKRQERKGRQVRIQPRYNTDQERLAARKASKAKYNNKDREATRAKWRAYAQKYKPRVRIYQRHRKATNPLFSIAVKLRKRLRTALNLAGARKSHSACELAGCTMVELKQHLESQFTEGMSWKLFCTGKIHIEHKAPCAAFDLTDVEQQKRCFHYTNLCPAWPEDNMIKSSIYNNRRWRYADHMPAPARA